LSGEDGTGGTASLTAALDALKGDAAFMERVDKRDAAAQAQLDQAYQAAYPDEPAGDDAGGVRVDRGGAADVPSSPEGYFAPPDLERQADPEQLAAFRQVAHAEGLSRRDFGEVADRYFALASKVEAPPTPEQFDQAMARWHGPDAPKILAVAQAAAKRAIAANPALAEVLAVVANDASAVTLIGLHELGKGRR
jgi:hypothetical protein